MTSEQMVAALVADLRPVRKIAGLGIRAARWAGASALWVSLVACVAGVRADLSSALHDPAYLGESAALSMSFALAAASAFRLGVPGVRAARWLPIAALGVWLVCVVMRAGASLAGTAESAGLRCVLRIGALASIPAAGALLALRRAAPLQPGWAGLCALLSASALAVLGTRLLCAKDDAAHVLRWHFVPVLIAMLLGVALGKLLLNRDRARAPAHDRG